MSVGGTGGDLGPDGFNVGVFVQAGGQIEAGGLGAVLVAGMGGPTADSGSLNYGVLVSDAEAAIGSSGGDVSVTGDAGGSGGSFNYGVAVVATGQIEAGATGPSRSRGPPADRPIPTASTTAFSSATWARRSPRTAATCP